jgi:hypothetical protein
MCPAGRQPDARVGIDRDAPFGHPLGTVTSSHRAGDEEAVQRPDANEGGREEEEKRLRIAIRLPGRLHG